MKSYIAEIAVTFKTSNQREVLRLIQAALVQVQGVYAVTVLEVEVLPTSRKDQ